MRPGYIDCFARIALCICLVVAVFAIPNGYRHYAIPFRLAKLHPHIFFRPDWELSLDLQTSEMIQEILSQPFTYVARGRQSFVFESQDGSYVLKLFRFDSYTPGKALISYVKKCLGKTLPRKICFLETLAACKLSFDSLRDETGIIWVHLNPRAGVWPSFQVRDKLGFSHRIDPAKYRFVLQKRGEKMFRALKKALREDRNAFQRMIQSFSFLLRAFAAKQIAVVDSKMPSNFGFLGEEAIQLDFASNIHNPELSEIQIERFREKMRGWLKKMDPDSVKYLEGVVK